MDENLKKEWRESFARRAKGIGEDFVPLLLELEDSLQKSYDRLKSTNKRKEFDDICAIRRHVMSLQDFIMAPEVPAWFFIATMIKERDITLQRARTVIKEKPDREEFESCFQRLLSLIREKYKEGADSKKS